MIAKTHVFAPELPIRTRPVASGVLERIQLWLERRRQRRTLLELNDHLLKDIGVSRSEAWVEGQKPFWRD